MIGHARSGGEGASAVEAEAVAVAGQLQAVRTPRILHAAPEQPLAGVSPGQDLGLLGGAEQVRDALLRIVIAQEVGDRRVAAGDPPGHLLRLRVGQAVAAELDGFDHLQQVVAAQEFDLGGRCGVLAVPFGGAGAQFAGDQVGAVQGVGESVGRLSADVCGGLGRAGFGGVRFGDGHEEVLYRLYGWGDGEGDEDGRGSRLRSTSENELGQRE